MTVPSEDFALIERAQRGDRDAFERLLRLHYDVIYRIACRWCGYRAEFINLVRLAGSASAMPNR